MYNNNKLLSLKIMYFEIKIILMAFYVYISIFKINTEHGTTSVLAIKCNSAE